MTDDAPPGFEFPRSTRLQKAKKMTYRVTDAVDGGDVVDADDAKKLQAVVTAETPADPSHGRPAGASNALAFHAWKKGPL